MRYFVVVPDGLDAPKADGVVHVSWVYQAVLDDVLEAVTDNDVVVLAPANNFGQNLTEHEAAAKYIKSKNGRINLICPRVNAGSYIDTRGNAVYLRKYLKEIGHWPLDQIVLCVYFKHARRAAMLFSQEGFDYKLKSIGVSSRIRKRKIVSRLWYYNFSFAHDIYEFLAYIFFRFKIK